MEKSDINQETPQVSCLTFTWVEGGSLDPKYQDRQSIRWQVALS